jgi:hypothetical protein
MVTDQTRNELWNQLLDIDANCRYYEAVYSRTTTTHFVVRVLTLVFLAGSITAVLNLLPWGNDLAKALLVVAVTALTVWDAVSNYPKKAAVAHLIHFQSVRVRSEMRDLWLSVEDGSADEDDIRRRLRELIRLANEIETWAGFSDITVNTKLNRKTTDEADKVVADYHRGSVPGTPQ